TDSARGPFGPLPDWYSTPWPSCNSSKRTPSSADMWKNRSPVSVVMNPNPLSVSFLILPCGIAHLLERSSWRGSDHSDDQRRSVHAAADRARSVRGIGCFRLGGAVVLLAAGQRGADVERRRRLQMLRRHVGMSRRATGAHRQLANDLGPLPPLVVRLLLAGAFAAAERPRSPAFPRILAPRFVDPLPCRHHELGRAGVGGNDFVT